MKVAIVTAVYNRAETIGQALIASRHRATTISNISRRTGPPLSASLEEIRARMRPEMRVIHEP